MTIHDIKAMLPGIFYRKPAPDSPNFKEIGDKVAEGEVIGLIEVMKSFHQVISDVNGTITEYCVENEDVITPGQILVKIEI